MENAQDQGSRFTAVKLVASVEADLLESLVDLDTFPAVNTVSDVNNDILHRWLQSQIEQKLDSFIKESIAALVKKSVHTKLQEPDSKLRILNLFADYKTFLRQKNMSSLLTDNPRLAVEHICMVIRPTTLRRKIESDLQVGMYSLRKVWKAISYHVLEKAVICDQFVPCTESDTDVPSPSSNSNGSQIRSISARSQGSRTGTAGSHTSGKPATASKAGKSESVDQKKGHKSRSE